MLAAERRRKIKHLVREQSNIRVQDLASRFNTSGSTIRRDLEYLEEQGVLKRIYGGAIVSEQAEHSAPPSIQADLSDKKRRIGTAAAKLIDDGETVFLGPGSTVLAVAHHLGQRQKGTVVTNALDTAAYLANHSTLSVILTGGQIERPERAMSGHIAELTLHELRADKAIIGVRGIHLPDGITGDSLQGVRLMRTLMDLVPQVVVVADAAKWGSIGPAYLAPLDAIDTIVTDMDAPPAMVWDVLELGIQVIQV